MEGLFHSHAEIIGEFPANTAADIYQPIKRLMTYSPGKTTPITCILCFY
jgi:hypothetical protein